MTQKNDTRWKDIYQHLKKEGFKIYSPGQKHDECTEPYLVLKDAGILDVPGISSVQYLYEVLCYVPQKSYSLLDSYVGSVKRSLDGLFPMIRPTYVQTPSYLDDIVKGHMVSIQYMNYRKKVRG